MCRLAAYMGDEILLEDIIITPKHSILDQSKNSLERESPLNGDGFGIAWYKPNLQSQAALFKDISPAWNNKNLHSLSSVTSSHLFLVHIRDASPAMPVIFPNNHPFIYDDYTFMHNGYIPQFEKIKKQIVDMLETKYFLQIHGNTDSEHFFSLFLQNISKTVADSKEEKIIHALRKTIQTIGTLLSKHKINNDYMLNTVMSNGDFIIGSRFHSRGVNGLNSLYYQESNTSILVSSEPLNSDKDWKEIPEDNIFIINNSRELKTEAI